MRTLKIQATEPQAAFYSLDCKYPAFVAGFGTGKSETQVNQAIMDASYSPNALIALYAPTYDLVRLITAPRLLEKLDAMSIKYNYNKSENIVYTEGQFGNFILRTLDNPSRIIGYESYRAHIDELDTLPTDKAREVWTKIIARNRQQPEGASGGYNRVSAYTTPEGYKFAYERWGTNVEGSPNYNADYQMIQASTMSNPFLPDDYVQSLRDSYPAELIEAYLMGKFTNLTSGTVYRSYDREIHRSTETVKQGEPVYIGMDFNIDNMAATIYVRRGEQWHIVDEIHHSHNVYSVADTIRDRYPNNKVYIYPDASGNNRTTTAEKGAANSDIAVLNSAKYNFILRHRKSNPRVRDRINAYNAALEGGLVYVNDKLAPESANCLEQQAYDKNGSPDKQSGNDHQNDATTYVIAYELPIRKPVANINFSFTV